MGTPREPTPMPIPRPPDPPAVAGPHRGPACGEAAVGGARSQAPRRRGVLHLLGLLALASCGRADPPSDVRDVARSSTRRQDAVALLRRIGLTVPASATVEYSRVERGLDDSARIVLLMTAADWARMRSSPPLDAVPPERYDADGAMALGASDEGCRPGEQPGIVGAQVRLPDAEILDFGVAPVEGGRVRVFLFWFET